MKKQLTLLSSALMMLCAFVGCSETAIVQNYHQNFDIEKKFLLIPIEEKADESQIWIEHNQQLLKPGMRIRVARTKVDYWVPLDVEQYKGQSIALVFEQANTGNLVHSTIKQSDSFDFDYNEQHRPAYHFSPKYGWTNDPNGMVYLDGEYHLFYQHNPYGSRWGNMNWGHAVTKDFVRWEHLPVAITPDTLGTIFSGSAVIDVNNSAGFGKDAMVAIYTYEGKVQTQGIAYSLDKGRTFTKYEGNPVIDNPQIRDFRDPKVFWHNKSNKWVMSLATTQTITFYGSANLKEWTKMSEFGDGIGGHGGVWECPDLFEMTTPDGKQKWVLFVSINPGGPNGGSATQYFIGDFDGERFTADPMEYPIWLDYGRDNYAGVTWNNVPQSDGRHIFIGWMSNWDYTNDAPTTNFRNATTLPRELTMGSNGRHTIIKSYPLSEVANMRGTPTQFTNMATADSSRTDKIPAEYRGAYEVEMTITTDGAKEFGFRLTNDLGQQMEYCFNVAQGKLFVDRTQSGMVDFSDKFPSKDTAPLTAKKSYKINLFIDKASSELFVDGGELVTTHTIFPTEPYNTIEAFSDGNKVEIKSINVYPIK